MKITREILVTEFSIIIDGEKVVGILSNPIKGTLTKEIQIKGEINRINNEYIVTSKNTNLREGFLDLQDAFCFCSNNNIILDESSNTFELIVNNPNNIDVVWSKDNKTVISSNFPNLLWAYDFCKGLNLIVGNYTRQECILLDFIL